MLVRFIVKNFLSFKESTEFNMLTGDIRRFPSHVFRNSKVDLLKTAVVYGANGAGKTNLVAAVDALVSMVSEGGLAAFESLPVFKLGESKQRPTIFEIDFLTGSKGYSYGVRIFEGIIQEEWLTRLGFGKKEDVQVFRRTALKNGKAKIIMESKYLKTEKDKMLLEVYASEILEPEKLFLKLVHNKKYSDITMAFSYIASDLFIINGDADYEDLFNTFMEQPRFTEFTNQHIKNFDTGVSNIEVETISFDSYFGEDLTERENFAKLIRDGRGHAVGDAKNAIAFLENGVPVIKKMVCYHTDSETGQSIKFELSEESKGTLRLLDFLIVLFLLENVPATVFIDEMDRCIHPALLKEFVANLQNNTNRKGQLIFTTHESNLLGLNVFRHDEIWFAEKSKDGSTQFYPLSDYNIRQDLDIRKGYLSGRFGAIPFLSELKELA